MTNVYTGPEQICTTLKQKRIHNINKSAINLFGRVRERMDAPKFLLCFSWSDTHIPEFVLALTRAIVILPCCIGTLDTVDGIDINDRRSSQLTQSLHSHIIFAHNLYLAFLPRYLMTIPATDVPLSVPSLENEEDRIPKPVPPLVEDQERARWHAQVHRHRLRLGGFGRFEDPFLVIDGYGGTLV
jgi:hypothetical protein